MKNSITKISLFILIGVIIFGCNTTKRVPNGKSLLTKNDIVVDGKKNNVEDVFNQLYQKQNSAILGYRLRLNIYNLAKQKTDSIYRAKFANNPNNPYDIHDDRCPPPREVKAALLLSLHLKLHHYSQIDLTTDSLMRNISDSSRIYQENELFALRVFISTSELNSENLQDSEDE